MSPENRSSKESLPKAGRGQETQRAGYLATLTLGVATAAMTACTVEDTDRFEGNSTIQYRNADAGINTSDVSELQTSVYASTASLDVNQGRIANIDCADIHFTPLGVSSGSYGFISREGFSTFLLSYPSVDPTAPLFPVMLPLDYESETHTIETRTENGVTYTVGGGPITQEQVAEFRFNESLYSNSRYDGEVLLRSLFGMSGTGTPDHPRENPPFYISRREGTLYTDVPYISVVDGEEVVEYESHALDASSVASTFDGCSGFEVAVYNEATTDYLETLDYIICGRSGSNTKVYRINADGSLHTEMSMRDWQINEMDHNGAFFKFTRGAAPFMPEDVRIWGGTGGAIEIGEGTWEFGSCTASFIPQDIEPLPDTGTPDAGTDATPDTGPDVEPEVVPDVQPEVDSTDTTPEEDTEADAETDTPQDVEPTPDTSPDVEPEVVADVEPEVDTTPEEDTEADAETDTPQDVEPGPDVRPDTTPENCPPGFVILTTGVVPSAPDTGDTTDVQCVPAQDTSEDTDVEADAGTDSTDTTPEEDAEEPVTPDQPAPVRGAEGCAAGPENSNPKGFAGFLLGVAAFFRRKRKK